MFDCVISYTGFNGFALTFVQAFRHWSSHLRGSVIVRDTSSQLKLRLREAKTYEEWHEIARQLDVCVYMVISCYFKPLPKTHSSVV
jgi:hypothetical protein